MFSVKCIVQSETVIRVCTVHSADWDGYWSVYSVQCSVKLLLVCVQCAVQIGAVIGVFTVCSVE